MATLPAEQVTQRNSKCTVAFSAGTDEDAGIQQWLSTTTLPYTVVNTSAVGASYDTPTEILTAFDTLDAAAHTDIDLNAEFGIGYPSIEQPLAVIGDGTEALAVANSETESLDISQFVVGGYLPLSYTLDDTLVDTAGVSASMVGSVLQVTAGATDGTDTAVVTVADRDGNEVEITVAITVA